MAIINPICAITKPAHPHIKVVKLNTYKLKTVDQTNDKTISICNLTDFGSDLMSDLESSNIMFAQSIIHSLNFCIILLIYLYYLILFFSRNLRLIFYKHYCKFSYFKTKLCHCCPVYCNSIILLKNPIIKSNFYLFSFDWY